jgi:hypothetical protein
MIPLATTLVQIDRPAAGVDPYATQVLTVVGQNVPGHISAPSGSDRHVGGDQENVDAVLYVDCCTDIAYTDQVLDLQTGDRYDVTWVRRRIGVGLDHLKAGLRASQGASNG